MDNPPVATMAYVPYIRLLLCLDCGAAIPRGGRFHLDTAGIVLCAACCARQEPPRPPTHRNGEAGT